MFTPSVYAVQVGPRPSSERRAVASRVPVGIHPPASAAQLETPGVCAGAEA